MATRRQRGHVLMGREDFHLHHFLRFEHEAITPERRAEFVDRLPEYIAQPIETPDVLDWSVMDRVVDPQRDGETGDMTLRRLMTQSYTLPSGDVGFVSEAWFRFFQIHEVIYRELVIEFYTTLRFDSVSRDVDRHTISFCLGGQPRTMSIVEFSVAVGLHTLDELHNPHFRDYLAAGMVESYSLVETAALWREIAIVDFGDRAPSDIHLRRPVHRLLHRLISASICGRHTGPEKVYQPDFFYLHTMIQGTVVSVPWRLVHWMTTGATGHRATSSLCGGQYVTRLARYFGMGAADFATLTIVTPGMSLLGEDKMIELGILQPGIEDGILLWTPEVVPGQQPIHRARLRGPPVPPPAVVPPVDQPAGRGRGRGRGRGVDLDMLGQRIDRLEVEHSRRFDMIDRSIAQMTAHMDRSFHGLFGHFGIPYETLRDDGAGPSRQPDQMDSDEDE